MGLFDTLRELCEDEHDVFAREQSSYERYHQRVENMLNDPFLSIFTHQFSNMKEVEFMVDLLNFWEYHLRKLHMDTGGDYGSSKRNCIQLIEKLENEFKVFKNQYGI